MGHSTSSLVPEGEVTGSMEHQLLDTLEEEDFYCPICQEVLKTPIRTTLCQHVFCRVCFRMAVRAQGPQCPMCRGPVEENERKAEDIQQAMKTRSGHCRACGAKRLLSRLRSHGRKCRKYIEEYGGPSGSTEALVQPTTLQAANTPEAVTGSVLVPVYLGQGQYSCPYCAQPCFSDHELVQHCVSLHREDRTPKVCPICAFTPWGDGDYFSRNLIAHLAYRHRFSYDAYLNTGLDEDTQLHWAVQLSMDEVGGTVRA